MTQRRVVCIEDEPDMIELVRLILARQGYECIGARSGLIGIEAVEATLPDLVLLDLMMPGIDGWQVYDHLKANPATKDIPVIIATARAQHDPRVMQMRLSNEDNLITKPFTPAQLIETIQHVLGDTSS